MQRKSTKSVMKKAAIALSAVAIALTMSVGTANACACCGTYQVVNVQSWDVLNIRSGPGVRFRIIGSFQPGEGCITLTGERRGNWVGVQGAGQTGWVNARYLRYIQ